MGLWKFCLFVWAVEAFLLEDYPSHPKHIISQPKGTRYRFNFDLTWELSMLYTADDGSVHNVSMSESGSLSYTTNNGQTISLDTSDVTTLDGFQTKYIAINGQIPGPTIEVALGAEVYVQVNNKMMTDAATIHWHGLTMKNHQWADGAAYVSQCPIQPGASFTYKFVADEAGTFWYHSHLEMQRMDGIFGALIVHDPKRSITPAFTVQINDWLHMDASQFAVSTLEESLPGATYKPIPDRFDKQTNPALENFYHDSILVNGKGRFNNKAPLTFHRVKTEESYMFRFINVGFDNLYEVAIDGHNMTIVGVDSCEVEPLVVDSVFLAVGERVDVIINGDNQSGSYWVRYMDPHSERTTLGRSILAYDESTSDPTSKALECSTSTPCLSFNCPFQSAAGHNCIPITGVKSKSYYSAEIDTIRSVYHVEEFLSYSYMAGDAINGRQLLLPPSHFYQTSHYDTRTKCDKVACDSTGCQCTNVMHLPYKASVQLVVTHLVLQHFTHSWHMHGHRFAVLKVGYPPKSKEGLISRNQDISCTNDFCHDARWVKAELSNLTVSNPPLKDTVQVPVGGFVVLRFYTDNPGYWMGHCHQTLHFHEGMGLVFDVEGNTVNMPSGFPRCGNFDISPE